MKRTLLFAACAVTTAVAVSAARPTEMQEAVSHEISTSAVETVEARTPAKTAFSFNNLRSITSGSYQVSALYYMPNGTFYGGVFPYGGKYYYSSQALIPTYTPLNYSGIRVATPVGFTDWDNISVGWKYFSGYAPNAVEEITSSEGSMTQVIPADIEVYDIQSPKFIIGYDGQADTCQTFSLMAGGRNLVITDQGVSPIASYIYPYTSSYGLILGFASETYYGDDMFDAANMTFSEYSNDTNMDRYAELFEQTIGEKLESTSLIGYYVNLGYAGEPYAISSLTQGFNYRASNGAELTYAFYRMDGSEVTDEMVYSYTVKFPATDKETGYAAVVEFTSVDQYDEELSYKLIDCPLWVQITGLQNFDMIAPHCAGYKADNIAGSQNNTNYGGSLLQLNGTTQTLNGVVSSLDYWTYGSGEEQRVYKSFDIEVDVEYPNLVATRYMIGGKENFFEYAKNSHYVVDLAEGENEVAVIIATSADYADELFFDDSELPEWLTYETETYYQEFLQQSAIHRGVALYLSITDGKYEKRAAMLPIEYKGKKITVVIGQDGEGNRVNINDVEAAADGAVEYFDVQGRKLQAAPANGFFLQRQGNKVTKVIR
ncbi:MAG: hypothetical protein K2N76_05930 [Muribaculaceae bacterium]|nr:hypothetical protein [Muribaculaceae bacterium]